jgi:hypothetical protein
MGSEQAMEGEIRIFSGEVQLVCRGDIPPSRTTTGAPLSKADKKVTDREKAYYTQTGASKKKVIRKLYEFIAEDAATVAEVMQASLNELILETNAANGY